MFVMHFDTMRFWDGSKEESGRVWEIHREGGLQEVKEADEKEM